MSEDLGLMGLHDLDSHLSIFESSVFRGESSTPSAMSNSPFGDLEQQSQTIIVDASNELYSPKMSYGTASRARFADQKYASIIQ